MNSRAFLGSCVSFLQSGPLLMISLSCLVSGLFTHIHVQRSVCLETVYVIPVSKHETMHIVHFMGFSLFSLNCIPAGKWFSWFYWRIEKNVCHPAVNFFFFRLRTKIDCFLPWLCRCSISLSLWTSTVSDIVRWFDDPNFVWKDVISRELQTLIVLSTIISPSHKFLDISPPLPTHTCQCSTHRLVQVNPGTIWKENFSNFCPYLGSIVFLLLI